MRKSARVALISPVIALLIFFVSDQKSTNGQRLPPPAPADALKVLQWRSIGPFRGGRSTAVAGVASQPMVFYFGGTGGGVWKTTDGGMNWKNIGLADTRQISRIRVHPKNPDIVYVAAQGHVWGANEQRGVFRSKDGGKTWEKVFYRSDKAGASDLIIDPTNPNNLYAGLWEVYRKPWTLESGGAGSGIFKSTDGGDTWSEITRNPGLPKGMIGIVGI